LKLTRRVMMIMMQNTGRVSNLAMTPEVPKTNAAPKVAGHVSGEQTSQC
jgi:hypothetical protein